MQKHWKYLIGISLPIVLVTSLVIPIVIYYLPKSDDAISVVVIIRNDEDFALYDFPGNGTKSDPYIIENYDIQTQSYGYGIYISNTTKYFVIRNCSIDAKNTGIQIENIASGTANITQNYCYGNYMYGICLVGVSDISVTNNNCTNNDYGIYLNSTSNIVVKNNTCSYNDFGVFLEQSSDIMILDNNFFHETSAIYIVSSSSFLITNNTCIGYYNQGFGIYLFDSSDMTAFDNLCINHSQGFSVHDSTNNTINNNLLISNSYGIFLFLSSETYIKNNTCRENFNGIYVYESNNNNINSNNCSANFRGLEIRDSSFTSISNNLFNNNSIYVNAILLHDTQNTIVLNNSCNNNGNGIYISGNIQFAEIIGNNCSGNAFYGIYLSDGSNCSIINNTCNNNEYGILISYSSSVLIENNILTDNMIGLEITYSSYFITVKNNHFYSCGLEILGNSIDALLTFTVTNNWIGSKQLGFFIKYKDTTFSAPNYGQLFFINCSDITVQNQVISNTSTCITIIDCENFSVLNNSLSNSVTGLIIRDSQSNYITKNNCSNMSDFGFFIESSPETDVINNTILNTVNKAIWHRFSSDATISFNKCNFTSGILVHASTFFTITENTCINSSGGALVVSVSTDCVISDNVLINSSFSGISMDSNNNDIINNTISGCTRGIDFYYSHDIVISNNTFSYNEFGMYIIGADNCIITFNVFKENSRHGLRIGSFSENNTIHHNSFFDNNPGGSSQAYDAGDGDYWYDTLLHEGNYWSDWIGVGGYDIDYGVQDPFPLSSPPVS